MKKNYTFTDRKTGKVRPATPAEQAYVRRVLALHKQYWKWIAIRWVALIVLGYLLIQEAQPYLK